MITPRPVRSIPTNWKATTTPIMITRSRVSRSARGKIQLRRIFRYDSRNDGKDASHRHKWDTVTGCWLISNSVALNTSRRT